MRDLGAPRQHLTVVDCTGCHALSVITRTCRYAELVHPGKITRQPDTLDDLSSLPTTAEQPPSPLTFPPGSPSLPSRCCPSPSLLPPTQPNTCADGARSCFALAAGQARWFRSAITAAYGEARLKATMTGTQRKWLCTGSDEMGRSHPSPLISTAACRLFTHQSPASSDKTSPQLAVHLSSHEYQCRDLLAASVDDRTNITQVRQITIRHAHWCCDE